MPPTTVIRKTTVSRALPAMTIGLRTRLERDGRGGIGTSSGCSAARGLRCAIGLGSSRRVAVEPRRLQRRIRLAGAGDGARTWRRQLRSGRLRLAWRQEPRRSRPVRPAAPADRLVRAQAVAASLPRGCGRRRPPRRWRSRPVRCASLYWAAPDSAAQPAGLHPAAAGASSTPAEARRDFAQGAAARGAAAVEVRGSLRRPGDAGAQADGRDLRRRAADWLNSPPPPRLHARRTPVTKDFKDGPRNGSGTPCAARRRTCSQISGALPMIFQRISPVAAPACRNEKQIWRKGGTRRLLPAYTPP